MVSNPLTTVCWQGNSGPAIPCIAMYLHFLLFLLSRVPAKRRMFYPVLKNENRD
jgi:hypothetical protein